MSFQPSESKGEKRLNERDQNEIIQMIEEEKNQKDQFVSQQKQPSISSVLQNIQDNDDEDDDDDEDSDDEQFLITKFSKQMQTMNEPQNNQLETKKLLKKTESIYGDDDEMQQEKKGTEGDAFKMDVSSNSASESEDDDEALLALTQKSNQSLKYYNTLKEINDEGYISLTIESVTKSKDEIPTEYWNAFKSVTDLEESIEHKDIQRKYSVTYLRVKVKDNKELEKSLEYIEVGLVLLGPILNDIEYDVGDQANFLGQFKYSQLKLQDSKNVHLFFSILHSNETLNKQENAVQDFFSTTNVLILEPDYILFPTLIAQSMSCYRTPLIKMKFCVTESTNWNMLKGTILHDVFEHLMEMHKNNEIQQFKSEEKEKQLYQEIIRKLYTKYIEDLFLLGKSIEEFENDIKYIAKNMFKFIFTYLSQTVNGIQVNGQDYISQGSQRKIRILRLVENEMTVNNESLGLKGQIDCIFLCEIEETGKPEKYKCFLPFELKTGGKKKYTYEDQSLFYCLLLNQKYHHKKNLEGFLYYLSFNEIISLSPTRKRTVSLITRRNKVIIF